MFEDSTFESTGRIKTRSRGWAIAAFTFNGSILLLLILIPLIFPQALGRQAMTFLMEAPPPPVQQHPPPQPPAQVVRPASEMVGSQLIAPRFIRDQIYIARDPEPALASTPPGWDASSTGGDPSRVFRQQRATAVVHQAPKAPVRISSAIEAGLLVEKTLPVYPPLGRAMRAQGTVVLTATISKSGTIENLRVVSGPPILQQAALDAVKTWRYKPYLLDGEPVEVETTVNVIFSLGQ